jgi:hypothetical protein
VFLTLTVLGLCFAAIGFVSMDAHYYSAAKFPERVEVWWSALPGGGIAAYLKFGRDIRPKRRRSDR